MSNQIRTIASNLVKWVVKNLPIIIYRERSGFLKYAIAIFLMAIGLFVRMIIAPVEAGLQYVVFFPPVTLAAVVGGLYPGLLATFLGICSATFIFTPPYYSISLEAVWNSFLANIVFFMDSVIVCASIEAMHRYRQKYENELDDVKRINKELDEFSYIASHDLKEPLRGIKNYASIIHEEYADKLDEEGKQHITSIHRLINRMASLMDNLLAYSKVSNIALEKRPFNVDKVLDDVILDLSSSIQASGVELRRIGKLGFVSGDAIRIGEVFQNLISNSTKYNDKHQKLVEIGRDGKNSSPVFYVRDNGIGIQPADKDIVFRLFRRLHKQNEYGGGSGAGQTIAKRIIEVHGGRIWLESVYGTGTTFYFTLNGDK